MRTKNYACPDDYGSMVLKGHGPCGAPISITKSKPIPLPNPIAGLIGRISEMLFEFFFNFSRNEYAEF